MAAEPATALPADASPAPARPARARRLLAVLAAAVLLLGAGALALRELREAVALREAGQLAGRYTAALSGELETMMQRMQALAAGLDLQAQDAPALQARLEGLQRAEPLFAWIGVTDRQGRALAATGGLLVGADLSARPWFRGGLKGRYFGDVHDVLLLAQMLPYRGEGVLRFLDIALPLHGPDGVLLGVLAGHVDWRWAAQVAARLQPESEATQLLVIDEAGVPLLGPPELVGAVLPMALRRALQPGAAAILPWPPARYALAAQPLANEEARRMLGWSVAARRRLPPGGLQGLLCPWCN